MKGKVLKTIRNIFDGVMIFLLFITTTVYALPSDGVIYDNSTSGQAPTNVNDALNDLYSKLNEKQNEINNINNIGNAASNHILNGYTAYVKGKTVTGSMANWSGKETTFVDVTGNITSVKDGQWVNSLGAGAILKFKPHFSGYVDGNTIIQQEVYGLHPSVVKAGALIGGNGSPDGVGALKGTFTSDADAVAGNILSGKTAYVNGSKITGSIPNKGATTYTPGTTNQTIAAGNYISGIQTIKGDTNLIAANIAKGKSIFGVNGTYTSDANAVAGNILSGKTAYVNGTKVTGTMANKSSSSLTYLNGGDDNFNQTFIQGSAYNSTVGAYDFKIPQGYWDGNTLTRLHIPNLLPNNIKAGIKVGEKNGYVTGTYTSDATATAADITSGKTAYVNGAKITGTASGGDAKVYTFSNKGATIPSSVTLKSGTWVSLNKDKDTTYSYSIDLGFTPSEVVACELKVSGDYSASSETSSSESFRFTGGYNTDGKTIAYRYLDPFITTSNNSYIYTNTSTVNYSGLVTSCKVSGSKLSFYVYKNYNGTGSGLDLYTRASALYLSGTLVYK